MPSRGGEKHAYLIGEAIKILADRHKNNLYHISIEDVKLDITSSLQSREFRNDRADRDFYPDIVASTKRKPTEKDNQYGARWTNDKRYIIECENGVSTLMTGKPSIRNYGYKMLHEKHKGFLIFVLVTWEKYKSKVKNNLWDEVWYIKED